jgi:peptidoglycan-associated lipoprotein
MRVWRVPPVRLCIGAVWLAAATLTCAPASRSLAEEPSSGMPRPAFRLGAPVPLPAVTDPATAMLERAKEEIRAGRTGLARRLLETLAARAPDDIVSLEARRLLRLNYVAAPPIVPAPGAVAATAPLPFGGPLTARPGPSFMPTVDGWRARVRPARPANAVFSATVGDRVFFGEGSADLGLHARHIVAAQARWLLARAELRIIVAGFADDPGSLGDNLDLARRRAGAVHQRLIDEGLARERITIRIEGYDARLVRCAEPECRHLNRLAVTSVYVGRGTGPARSDLDAALGSGPEAGLGRARR